MEATTVVAATPATVCNAVRIYLRRKGTLQDAANKLGVSSQAVSAQLSYNEEQNKYFTQRSAQKFSEAFGFSVEYLTRGVGKPFTNSDDPIIPTSYRITLPYGADPKEVPTHQPEQPVAPVVNASIWTAFESMKKEMNDCRYRYLALVESARDLTRLLTPDSDEAKAAARTLAQLESVSIPELGL